MAFCQIRRCYLLIFCDELLLVIQLFSYYLKSNRTFGGLAILADSHQL